MRGALRSRNLRRVALFPLQLLILPIAYLVPRDPGLWLFAYTFGYKDNPRYQFEHVVEHGPRGVRPIWFAQTRAETEVVAATGRPAVWKRSPRGWLLQLRAGVVVIGSGLGELNRPLVGRARIVQLWHGAPFKRIHGDFPEGDDVLPGDGPVARFVNGLVRRISRASRARVAMVPAQGPLVSSRFQTAFGVGPQATPVVGTPRADVIGRSGEEGQAEARRMRSAALGPVADAASRLVLYAPTWRDFGTEAFLADGLDISALETTLEAHDAALLIRMHPLGDESAFAAAARAPSGRIVVDRGPDIDINVLMRAVDMLVTDYSAISVDYALLGRPIVFFMPDLEAYESGRGLYESPSRLTAGLHCTTWPDTIAALHHALADPREHAAAADRIAERYFAFRDTESCARITRAIVAMCGIG